MRKDVKDQVLQVPRTGGDKRCLTNKFLMNFWLLSQIDHTYVDFAACVSVSRTINLWLQSFPKFYNVQIYNEVSGLIGGNIGDNFDSFRKIE